VLHSETVDNSGSPSGSSKSTHNEVCWPKMNIRSRISLKGEESLVGGGAQSEESVRAPTQSKAMTLTLTVGERSERPDRGLGPETGNKHPTPSALHTVCATPQFQSWQLPLRTSLHTCCHCRG